MYHIQDPFPLLFPSSTTRSSLYPPNHHLSLLLPSRQFQSNSFSLFVQALVMAATPLNQRHPKYEGKCFWSEEGTYFRQYMKESSCSKRPIPGAGTRRWSSNFEVIGALMFLRENGGWNPGIHNHRSFGSFEDSSFTLFVDNLPRDVGPRWFRSFFSKFGIVKKSFIPYKISKRSGCRFGFITFGKRDEADMAIAKAHGIRIDNRSLFVKMASFSKNDRSGVAGSPKDVGVQNGEHHTNVWKKGFKSFSEVVTGSDNFGSVIKLDELGNEWLLRSVTAKLAPSKSLVLVQDQLANLGYLNIQVRTMGGDYLVLTFPTVEACNAVFNNGEFAWLQDWFLEIHKWDKHRVIPPSRSVWLNCFGVPLHLWNSVTFNKIGQIWGNVLEISNDTIQETSFCVGKVLISTQTLDVINQVILVENKGVQFKIRVCEEQIVVNTILRAECNCKGCKEEGELNIEENELVNRSEQGSHMEETKVEGAVDAD